MRPQKYRDEKLKKWFKPSITQIKVSSTLGKPFQRRREGGRFPNDPLWFANVGPS